MKWPKREKWNELFALLWEEFLDTVVPRRRLNQRFLNAVGHMRNVNAASATHKR
jgi:hypothetical protein